MLHFPQGVCGSYVLPVGLEGELAVEPVSRWAVKAGAKGLERWRLSTEEHCCSSRRFGFGSQHPLGSSQSPVTNSVPGYLTYMQAKTPIPIKNINYWA